MYVYNIYIYIYIYIYTQYTCIFNIALDLTEGGLGRFNQGISKNLEESARLGHCIGSIGIHPPASGRVSKG